MNALRPIDTTTWPRAPHFAHYRESVPSTYAITVELDATRMVRALHDSARKTYPTQIWALASVVNRHDEFRMGLTDDGAPGVWDAVHPAFTVFNPERETFASVWTPFDADFGAFHDRAVELLTTHRSATSMLPQSDIPPNVFDISSLPWTSFTGFSLQIKNGWEHLLPIFTLGRYTEKGGRIMQPLSIQVHHAAADGFHTSRLLEELQSLLDEPDWISS